jgi:hypothetical protein
VSCPPSPGLSLTLSNSLTGLNLHVLYRPVFILTLAEFLCGVWGPWAPPLQGSTGHGQAGPMAIVSPGPLSSLYSASFKIWMGWSCGSCPASLKTRVQNP